VRTIHILFIFFLIPVSGITQVAFNSTRHDFGDLESYDLRYIDIVLSNKGQKEAWVLSVKKPREVAYIISNQIIPKDSTTVLRFQINPKEKGRFNYSIDVFTSDKGEATKIKLSGNLRDLEMDNSNSFTACPTFSDRPGGGNPNDFDLTVVTIDKDSREELSNSNVTMIQNGRAIWENTTNRKGIIKEDATLGLSYFFAEHEGYYSAEKGQYVNFRRNHVLIELERDRTIVEAPPVLIDTTTLVVIEPEPEIISEIETDEPDVEQAPPITTIETNVPVLLTDLDRDNFDEEYFNPVNVVFILDVSSSMKQVDKIELMKYSLMQLTDMLRPQDKFSIVTYATDSRVILKPTSGSEKEKIKNEIEELKAYGYTAGGSGIKLGYKTALKSKISNGTNHVILITDGAFNRNSDDYKRYIKKYLKKGITMSVVGIRNKTGDKLEMEESAILGGGRYVPIMKLEDAKHNLKNEIRVQSYKF